MRCAQAGDGVDHQKRVRAFEQARDSLNIVPHAGGAFRALHEEHAVISLEFFTHLLRLYRLTVRCAYRFQLATVGLGQALPALAELSRRNHQHLVAGRGQVGHGRFHGARAGGGEHHHIVLCADERFQISQHTGV